MEITENTENWGGNSGLFLMAIFLVVLFSLFRRNNEGRREEGCADKLTWARYANFEDPAMAKLQLEQAVDTGKILREQAVNAGNIQFDVERQTKDIQLLVGDSTRRLEIQAENIARDQERMFFQNIIDQKNEKIADLREANLRQDIRAQSELNYNRTEFLLNSRHAETNWQLNRIENEMLKRPPYYGCGGIAAINACPPCGSCG